MMVRFSPSSEFTSGASPIEGSPVGLRGGRLSERLLAASIGSAAAGTHDPFKATIPRVNSSDMQTRSNASNRALIASGSSLKRGKLAQALFDIAFVLGALALVAVTAASVFGSVFILFFVRL